MSRTFIISRALKKCQQDKAILEKYFRTTAQKIRAEIQRQREQRMKAARENALFIAAQKEEPGLTLGHHQADLFLKDLAAGKVKFAPHYPEERGPPVTASEYKATAGGRKTRRKRRRKKKKSRRKRKTHRRRKRRKTRKRRR